MTNEEANAVNNEAFFDWCQSFKICTYCRRKFWGPVCACEQEKGGKEKP